MTRRTFAAAVGAVAVLVSPAVAAGTTTIEADDNVFKPATATVSVGDTVTWRNTGDSAHEVTASAFKSGNLDKGATYSWKATAAGTYSYVCRYHESVGMRGTLVVRAASTGAAQPASGHPKTGGDTLPLGLLVVGVAAIVGLSLRFGWRTR
jgi:plastocyanin